MKRCVVPAYSRGMTFEIVVYGKSATDLTQYEHQQELALRCIDRLGDDITIEYHRARNLSSQWRDPK